MTLKLHSILTAVDLSGQYSFMVCQSGGAGVPGWAPPSASPQYHISLRY